jgi:membrane protease YdiL (CAAX protease family)
MPTSAQVALAIIGPAAHAASWWVIRTGRRSIWWTSGVTMAALGILALVIGPIHASKRFGLSAAVGIGIGSGVALYGSTLVFLAVTTRTVPTLARQTSSLYQERGARSLVAALAIPVLLSAPGEELLWRGTVLGVLEAWLGSPGAAAVVTWAGFVIVNLMSGSLPIVLGAVVGGAAWTALAWWTGGVAASIACHVVWTGLMIAVPPPGART